jgi:hypothetical protein
MSKPRRPKGPRSTWEPKPPPVADQLATVAPIAEPSTALPVAVAPEVPPEIVERALAHAAEAPAAGDQAPEAHAPDRDAEPPAAPDPVAPEIEPSPDVPPGPRLPLVAANGNASTAHRIAFAPDRLDVVEIGSTVARYMRGEGEAAVAHLRALSSARTPAEIVRLQVGEVQRAADASLTCWVAVLRKASRIVAFR